MALPITITDAGRAEIINAENNGTGAVLITEIGFGTGQYTPTANQTVLQAQIKRVSSIAGQAVADDTIHVMAKDETASAYNVGEFGLFSDKGTLIAVYSQPVESGWIIQKAGPSTLLLATDIILESLNAASLTFGDILFINPPATTTVQGVVELATPEETQAGTDGARAVTPAGLKTLTGSTSRAGLLQLNNTLTSTSTSQALTAAQGKKLQDEKQPLDATLTALAALVTAANKLIYTTGVDTFATTDLTAFARLLLANANAAGARETLAAAPLDSPTFTGAPRVPTPAATDGDSKVANMAAVRAVMALYGIGAQVVSTETDLNLYTTGGRFVTPTSGLINLPPGWPQSRYVLDVAGGSAYSAQLLYSAGDASRKVAFRTASGSVFSDWAFFFHTGNVSAFIQTLLDDADASSARATLGAAPVASPSFTGNPTAPTPAQGNSSTLIATTRFVQESIAGKQDKATTLAGYGITDAQPYSSLLAGFVSNTGWGIGYQVVATESDLNAYIVGGKSITPSSGLLNLPDGWSQGRHLIDVTGGVSYCMQVLAATSSRRVAIRTTSGINGFEPWMELWHSLNHVESTQLQAEQGTDGASWMSPRRVFQAIAKKVVQATEALVGSAKIATQALVNAGVDDTTIVTPKKLRWGFQISLTANGYIVFPSWLGSLILQWGITTAAATSEVSFPLAFPNALFAVVSGDLNDNSGSGETHAISAPGGGNGTVPSLTGAAFTKYLSSGSSTHRVYWVAVGH